MVTRERPHYDGLELSDTDSHMSISSVSSSRRDSASPLSSSKTTTTHRFVLIRLLVLGTISLLVYVFFFGFLVEKFQTSKFRSFKKTFNGYGRY